VFFIHEKENEAVISHGKIASYPLIVFCLSIDKFRSLSESVLRFIAGKHL